MRAPMPVLMNPLATKNAKTINQTTRSLKPLKASSKLNVLLRRMMQSAVKAIAPIGMALIIIPKIVAIKMAKRCHPCSVAPEGIGRFQTNKPRRSDSPTKKYLFKGSLFPIEFMGLRCSEDTLHYGWR